MPQLDRNLLETFRTLLDEAIAAGEPEAIAMNLATADARGRVSSRIVLLKAVDENGFVFYTNLQSRKSEELQSHPQAALCFHWKRLRHGVQVRIEGEVMAVSATEADAYFASRPRGSQIGAWASDQSRTLDSREQFEARIDAFEKQFAGLEVPRPPHWSGWRLVPDRLEFWYGAEFRLHDRHLYEWIDGAWQHRLLFP